MSRNATVQRFLPVLFFLCAGAFASTALAQSGENGGDAVSNEPKTVLVGCEGGRAMISSDGGNSWRLLDAEAAAQARRGLESPAPSRSMTAGLETRRATAAPNPTSGRTEIRFTTVDAESVTITLHSTSGVEVLRTTDLALHPGTQIATIDASAVAAGNYFFRVQSGSGRVLGEGSLAIAR